MALLYVETNFLMSIATGQDPEASELLSAPPARVRLVVPAVCFMEALSALNEKRRERRRLKEVLEQAVRQLRRDITSVHARELRSHLDQSRIENQNLLRQIDSRLFDAMHRLIHNAESIPLTAPTFEESRGNALIEAPTDNLILHCILAHARSNPSESKAFLSNNTRDFGDEVVQSALRGAGIDKYFSKARDVLGWASSLTSP